MTSKGFTAEQLSDREQIRDAVLRYCHGLDRLDGEYMKTAYWPDAIDDHGNFVGNAHDFSDYCMEAHLKWEWTMHSVYNHLIDLDSDGVTAHGEVYNITNMQRVDSRTIDTWYGRYLDTYEKRNGEWRIIYRVCTHNGTATGEPPPMAIDPSKYRQGSFDRPSANRPLGPGTSTQQKETL